MPMSDHGAAIAGGSARAEYERRHARHQSRVRRRQPLVIGIGFAGVVVGLMLTGLGSNWTLLGWAIAGISVLKTVSALFITPGHVRAWDTGAAGEERTGALLAALESEGYRVLHDRRIPGSRANIDHIVIGPSGVFVVETKSYAGAVQVKRGELLVAGRRRTEIIDQVWREASVVGDILPDVEVTPLVCIHRADLPLRRVELDGVRLVGGKGLIRRLREPLGELLLSDMEVDRIADLLDARLRPAT
jgi:hypothetical protein